MTILERSQTRYAIEVKNSRWWLLVTLACLWFGLSVILDATMTSLTCHRVESNDGQCQYSRRKLLQTTTQDFGLNHVTAATVYTTTGYIDKNGKQHPEYPVALIMDQVGSLTLYVDTNLSAQEMLADNINGYLANPGRIDLNVTRDEGTGAAAIGLLIIAGGLWWAILVLKTFTYTFDKAVGTLTVQTRLLWTRQTTYALTDVLGLYIQETESYNKNRPPHREVHIVLRGQTDITTQLPANDPDLFDDLRHFLSKQKDTE